MNCDGQTLSVSIFPPLPRPWCRISVLMGISWDATREGKSLRATSYRIISSFFISSFLKSVKKWQVIIPSVQFMEYNHCFKQSISLCSFLLLPSFFFPPFLFLLFLPTFLFPLLLLYSSPLSSFPLVVSFHPIFNLSKAFIVNLFFVCFSCKMSRASLCSREKTWTPRCRPGFWVEAEQQKLIKGKGSPFQAPSCPFFKSFFNTDASSRRTGHRAALWAWSSPMTPIRTQWRQAGMGRGKEGAITSSLRTL